MRTCLNVLRIAHVKTFNFLKLNYFLNKFFKIFWLLTDAVGCAGFFFKTLQVRFRITCSGANLSGNESNLFSRLFSGMFSKVIQTASFSSKSFLARFSFSPKCIRERGPLSARGCEASPPAPAPPEAARGGGGGRAPSRRMRSRKPQKMEISRSINQVTEGSMIPNTCGLHVGGGNLGLCI